MFADKIGESCSTLGTGTYQLAGRYGTFRTFLTGFASGSIVAYYATNDKGTVWELGYGTVTTGSPATLTRNLLASSNGALISWETTPYRIYNVPSGPVLTAMLSGGLGGALPAWAPPGYSRWSYDDDAIGTLWKLRLNKAGAGELELGRYDVAKDAFFPSPRRPFTAVGAANKTIGANDIGGVFTQNNAGANRTFQLPLNSTAGIRHGFRVGGLGLTAGGQYGIVVTPHASDAIEGGADGIAVTVPGGVRFDVVWDDASDTWRIEYLNNGLQPRLDRRQTVAAGPVSTAGLPTFLPSTNGSLGITTQNVSAANRFVATAANGVDYQGRANDRVGISLSNIAWTGLTASRAATAPNYLYLVINADGTFTSGSTVRQPIYQWGGTPATTSGQFTFNIAEMKGYLGNGSSAPEVFLVFVGEAATNASTVISTVAYAYNGRFESAFTATLPSAATFTSANHNLGVMPRNATFVVENTTTEFGYAVGQQVTDGLLTIYSTLYATLPITTDTKLIGIQTGISGAFVIIDRPTGNAQLMTLNRWKYGFVADRGW